MPKTKLKGITAIRLEVLPDPSLPAKGPGRAPNGNFVLNEFKVTYNLDRREEAAEADRAAQRPGDVHAGDVLGRQRHRRQPGDRLGDLAAVRQGPHGLLRAEDAAGRATGASLTITLVQMFPGKEHNIGSFRLSVTTNKTPLSLKGPPAAIASILTTEPTKRTPQQKAELTNFYRAMDPELPRLRQLVAEHPMPVDKRLPGRRTSPGRSSTRRRSSSIIEDAASLVICGPPCWELFPAAGRRCFARLSS